jgi:rubrerythrin
MTEKNLRDAFAGESQAHMKYLAFAKQAEKEGLPNVARLFKAVSHAEVKHAHYHLAQLEGIGSTIENLQGAFDGEDFEIESMYPAYTAVGELEGEKGAVRGYYLAVEAEKNHRPLYSQTKELVALGQDLDATPIYVCGYCGHTGTGEPPEKCPVCGNERKNFKVF